MTLKHTIYKKLSKLGNSKLIKTKFFYPKIVLFENENTCRILDLENKPDSDEIYNLQDVIIDSILQGHFLWLYLKSGDIMLIDLLNGSQIKIKVNNYSNLKFAQVTVDNVLFTSDSGEILKLPISMTELEEKIKNGTLNDICISLDRFHNQVEPKQMSFISTNGLCYYLEQNQLISECPVTKEKEIVFSSIPLNAALGWGDLIILAHEGTMWIIDLKIPDILFEFKNHQMQYLPIAVYNDTFYYITRQDEEMCICSAVLSTSFENDTFTDSSSFTEASRSQDALLAELKLQMLSILEGKTDCITPQLQSLFENIDNFDIMIDSALQLYKHKNSYKSLLYQLQKKACSKIDNTHVQQISDILIKTDLIEYINFRGITSYDNVDLFEMDHKQLCITFLSKSDFDIASICWLKYSELNLFFVAEDIIQILSAIPSNTKMGSIVIWLKNFAPMLLEQNPYYIDVFVRWAMERIFVLEKSTYWPKIGLKFIDDITNVFEMSLKIICVKPISIDDLDMVKDKINYIYELKTKYKINMLLSELISLSPSEVALIMLRRCYTEDLNAFLEAYLPSFATRHLFDLDEILKNFVEFETASSGGVVDGTRLEIILNAFRSLNNKLECLLNVLKVLDVPWSANVLQLSVKAAASALKDFTISESDHMLAKEVQKEINFANVRVVLKKYNYPLTCTEYSLVLQKVVNAPMVDLKDLKAITTIMSAYSNYGNALYINKCLENCDTKSSLEYFQTMSHKEKNILIKTILAKYEQIIKRNTSNRGVERNYIDFLKGTQMLNESQINDIVNLYNLKHSHRIQLDFNQIYNENVCAAKLEHHLQNYKDSNKCVSSVYRIIPSNDVKTSSLMVLLKETSATYKVRNFVENLINMCVKGSNRNIYSLFKEGNNSDLLIEASNILVELINRSKEEYLHHLLKHMAVLNTLINAEITVKNLSIAWKFNYIFLPISPSNEINEYIDQFGERAEIETNICNIYSKCDLIPFRIVSNAICNEVDIEAMSENIIVFKERFVKRVLGRVAAAQDLDEVLITILLVLLKNENCIDDLLRGQSDVLKPSLATYFTNPTVRRSFSFKLNVQANSGYPPQYILKSKFNINLSEITLPDSTEETSDVKVILFYILKHHPDTPSDRLAELCRALDVSLNDGLSLHLIALLSTWDLKYRIINEEISIHKINVEEDPSLINRCRVMWENIQNKDFLKDVLNDFWKNGEVTLHGRVVSVNPYYYEIFLCIHSLLFGSHDSSKLKEYYLLHFLKDYKRISVPKQYEFETFSVKGMFPEIGHYRLPFLLFMRQDMWSNLKSEITLETYERWLPVVSLLSLDKDLQIAKDMICSNALKQTMTTRKRNDATDSESKETEPWLLSSRDEPLVRAAHRCVRYIANMEWAGACLFYVLQGCSRGADQVAAAHLCYQFAQRWAALQPGNRAVKQMERLHATLSTRHVLHKIEWAREEFVRIVSEPALLIRTLYLHPDFVNKITRFDLNRAANEIADKNNINIGSIRIQILENLLDKSSENNKDRRAPLSTKELITAKYILKATCPKMGAIYLSRIAFDDESDYNKCKKMRALQCLMSVVEPDTAIKTTNRERDALWTSLLELLSTVKLENVDIPWVVATFLQDKCRALEQLIQAVDGNVEGLRITADLASHFGSDNIRRSLIPLLLKSSLYEEMIPLLLKIPAPRDSATYAAWRAVILSPFQRGDYPITERQKIMCLNAINLLPVCPIIKDEDLKDIWKNCVRLKSFGLGCLVLPYMSPQARQSLAELQKIDRRNLIASLKNLHTETYLVSGAMYVVENMGSRGYK